MSHDVSYQRSTGSTAGARRTYDAEQLLIFARMRWGWHPCTDPDGHAVAWPDGPRITAELVAAEAYRTRLTTGPWVPSVGAVHDAELVLRGLALTGGWAATA